MAVAHASVVYDIADFKIRGLLTDVSPGPATYDATSTDVPGIATVSMEPNIIANELKGDAMVIAKKGTTDRFNYSATYGRLSLDVLSKLLGGTVTDQTTVSSTYTIGGVNNLPYFKAEFYISQAEVGSVNVTSWKNQITGGTLLDQSTDAFGQPKIDFEGIPQACDATKFLDIVFYASATPLT